MVSILDTWQITGYQGLWISKSTEKYWVVESIISNQDFKKEADLN